MSRKRKKAKIDTWKGWEDKIELVDKLPPLSDDEKPLTVKELEAKGFRGESVEDYEKRTEKKEESEVSKRERLRRSSEKTNPFRDVSGVSRGKKERDFRRPEDKERVNTRLFPAQKKYESPFEPFEAPDFKPVEYTPTRSSEAVKRTRTTDDAPPAETETPDQGVNLPQRNLNPINVKYAKDGIANKYAKKDSDGNPVTDEHGHLVFPDKKSGWAAANAEVKAKVEGRSRHGLSADSTLAEFGNTYAEDPNWASGVAQMLGVNTDTTVGSLDIDTFVDTIARQEGWYAGTEEEEVEEVEEELPRKVDPKAERVDNRAVTSSAADAAFSDMESEIDRRGGEGWEGSTFEQRKMTKKESKALRERSRAAKSRTSTRTKKPTEEPIPEDLPREIDLPEGSTSPDSEAEKFYAQEEERLGTLYKVTKEEGEDIVDERAGFGGFLKGVGGAIKRKATGDDRPAYIREPENEAVVLEVNLKELARENPHRWANSMARGFAQRHYMDTYLADEYEEITDASTRTRKTKGDIENLSPSHFYDDDSGILFVTYKPRNVLWNGKNMLEEQEQ